MMGQLLSSWNALAARDRRSLVICAIFFAGMGLYLGVIEPVYNAFGSLQQQKQELKNTIEVNQNAALSVVRRRAKLEEVRNESEYLVEKLDIEDSGATTLGETLYNLKVYAREAGVVLDQAAPLDMVERTEYEERPFIVLAKGCFAALSKFVYFLETSPMVLVISDLQLQGQDDQLSLRLQLAKVSVESVEADIAESYLNVLHIGLEHWIGFAPFYIAKKKGWLDGQDINIELIHGTDTDELSSLMRSGDLDGLCLSLSEQIAAMEEGFQLKAVYPLVWSSGGAGIVVSGNSSAHSLQDLEQVDIYGAGREAQYVVYRAFKENKLSFSPQQVHNLSSPLVMQSLSTGLIKAGVLWDPYLSRFQQEQPGKTLFRFDKETRNTMDNLVLREDLLQKKPEAVAFLLQALEKADTWIAAHPEEAGQILAELLHMSESSVQQGLAALHFPSPEEQQELTCGGNSDLLVPFIQEQKEFLESIYQKKVSLPAEEFFDWSLIRPLIACPQSAEPEGVKQ